MERGGLPNGKREGAAWRERGCRTERKKLVERERLPCLSLHMRDRGSHRDRERLPHVLGEIGEGSAWGGGCCRERASGCRMEAWRVGERGCRYGGREVAALNERKRVREVIPQRD